MNASANMFTPFRFFDLPSELRICIYKCLIREQLTPIPAVHQSILSFYLSWGLEDAAITQWIDTASLLVNKKFLAELQGVLYQQARLRVLVSADGEPNLFEVPGLPRRDITVPSTLF